MTAADSLQVGGISGLEGVLLASAGISALAMGMTLWNLAQYQRPRRDDRAIDDLVSVCIPARNEQSNLEACVRGLLASTHANLEVLVYDDQSTDATPRILDALIASDPRVRRVATHPLPEGWNGKQHACWRMSQAAKGRWLLFTDADVRFEPGAVRSALLSACAGTKDAELGMVSTFPRQITGTLSEALVVPMIFFILFSYLPFVRMRGTKDPSASAGCGQFLFVRRDAYQAAGTHEAFKASMHDGIKLPRLVRKAGFVTDLFDGTDVVSCRMYFGLASTWRGFAKNAYEGLGTPVLLVFLTVMHAIGHVLPWAVLVLLALGAVAGSTVVWALVLACLLMHLAQRLVLAARLRTSMAGALLHPAGIVLMTLIQWHSFVLHLTGRRSWRGRTLHASTPQQPSQPA